MIRIVHLKITDYFAFIIKIRYFLCFLNMSVHIVNAFVKFINNNLEYLVASFLGTVLQNVCNNKMDYFKKTPLSMSLSIELFCK